ncbi:hypothetical protein HG531_004765 [Fusarium graminearum]|nr:hypothetical protein HG531_004765 [Fusarium graminearum]
MFQFVSFPSTEAQKVSVSLLRRIHIPTLTDYDGKYVIASLVPDETCNILNLLDQNQERKDLDIELAIYPVLDAMDSQQRAKVFFGAQNRYKTITIIRVAHGLRFPFVFNWIII